MARRGTWHLGAGSFAYGVFVMVSVEYNVGGSRELTSDWDSTAAVLEAGGSRASSVAFLIPLNPMHSSFERVGCYGGA